MAKSFEIDGPEFAVMDPSLRIPDDAIESPDLVAMEGVLLLLRTISTSHEL